jgi:ubiquinone/menaquinone biosynthesis C-methylase UbiE
MSERPGYVPESESSVEPEKPRRHAIGPELMRFVNDLKISHDWLAERAEKMVEQARVQKYLMPKVEWKDPSVRHPSPKNRIDVLCMGSGKGHEAVEILMTVPGSEVTLVDPHDGHTQTVKEMIETLSDESKELSEQVAGENLKDIEDASMDGVTLNYVLHNMNGEARRAAVLAEARRVLKDDGYLFVAEDAPDTKKEVEEAKKSDRFINAEIKKRGEKEMMSADEWAKYLDGHGFEVVETNVEENPKEVRHAYFVLRKKR